MHHLVSVHIEPSLQLHFISCISYEVLQAFVTSPRACCCPLVQRVQGLAIQIACADDERVSACFLRPAPMAVSQLTNLHFLSCAQLWYHCGARNRSTDGSLLRPHRMRRSSACEAWQHRIVLTLDDRWRTGGAAMRNPVTSCRARSPPR